MRRTCSRRRVTPAASSGVLARAAAVAAMSSLALLAAAVSRRGAAGAHRDRDRHGLRRSGGLPVLGMPVATIVWLFAGLLAVLVGLIGASTLTLRTGRSPSTPGRRRRRRRIRHGWVASMATPRVTDRDGRWVGAPSRCASLWSGPVACRRATAGSRPASRRSAPGWPTAVTMSSCTAALAGDRRSAPEPTSYRGMSLVHLGALKRRSLETLSHTGLSVAHLARHRTDVASCSTRPTRRGCRSSSCRAFRWRPMSTAWSGSAGSGGRPGALLPGRRAAGGAVVGRADRRRCRDRRLLPREVRRRYRPDLLRRAAIQATAADRIAELGSPAAGSIWSSPGSSRRTTSTSSSTATAERGRPAADRGRVRAVRRRVHPQGARPGRRPGAVPRRRVGPGTARPAVRQRASPTCTGTPSAAPTPRCCAPSGPARRPRPSTSCSTARCSATRGCTSPAPTTSLGWWNKARPMSRAPAPAGSSPPTGLALRLGRRRRPLRGSVPAAGRQAFGFPLGAGQRCPGRRGRQRRFLSAVS